MYMCHRMILPDREGTNSHFVMIQKDLHVHIYTHVFILFVESMATIIYQECVTMYVITVSVCVCI